jgi:serine/threonine protein kinase
MPYPMIPPHQNKKEFELLEDLNFKVIDFGMGSILKEEDSFRDTKLGTPMYTAPEVINDSTYDAKKSDVWSLGNTHSPLCSLIHVDPPSSPPSAIYCPHHVYCRTFGR